MADDQNLPSFSELGLKTHVLDALTKLGYETPSPIQAAAIPELLQGRDMLGMAQTGTGKTAAFALPILSDFNAKKRSKSPTALVLAPTRELAQQVAEAFKSYGAAALGCKILSVYGGAPYTTQTRALRDGVDIVVGTPGRVMDHMRRGNLDVSQLDTLVLDEADEMLRMGFIEDVEWVLSQTPDNRRIALFSATMPPEVARIARDYLNDPAEVKIEAESNTASTIRQRYITVQSRQKKEALVRVLEVEPTDGVMIFVRTKLATTEVADFLRAQDLRAEALSGDLSQEQRNKAVQRLKDGKIDIVVATDVAARGLDVDRISHVINYDIPHDPEAYVHRIGRTGRAGRSGEAILLVQPREQRMLRLIERVTRSRVEEMSVPTVDQINEVRLETLKARLLKRLERDLTRYRELVAQLQESTGLSIDDLAVALAVDLNRGNGVLLDSRHEFKAAKGRDRSERPERAPRERRVREPRPPRDNSAKREKVLGETEMGKERFRVEVGHEHGVKPGNLVGAIANEAGLDSQDIGRIELFDTFSVIDLPEGMPKDLFKHLKGVWVCGQKLGLSRFEGNLEENPMPAKGGRGRRDDNRGGNFGGHRGGKPAGKHGGRSGPRREDEGDNRRGRHGGHPAGPRDAERDTERDGDGPVFKSKRKAGKATAKPKAKKPKARHADKKNKGKPKRKPKA